MRNHSIISWRDSLFALFFRHEITTIDMNNNSKTKANDSASKQSPLVKSNVDKGTERPRVTSNTVLKQPENREQLKTEDKIKGIPSVAPGMRKLALQEIEHPDGKVNGEAEERSNKQLQLAYDIESMNQTLV